MQYLCFRPYLDGVKKALRYVRLAGIQIKLMTSLLLRLPLGGITDRVGH